MSEQKPLNIRVPEEKRIGVYANLVSITIADNEVALDFVQVVPNGEGGDLVSRVIVSPFVARNFMSAFQNAILDFDIAKGKRKESE